MSVWLTILACCPAPAPPCRTHFEPIAFQQGSSRSTVVASPPIMIESVPLRAPTSPPETGASIAVTPRSAAARGDLLGQRRLAGGHVDQHAAWPQPASAPSLAEDHLAHVAGIADDREHDVGLCGRSRGRIGPRGAARDERVGLGPRAVVDRHAVARRPSAARTCSCPSRPCRSSRGGCGRE